MTTFEMFESLPDTVIMEYLERLPEEELYNMCRSSKRLRDLCKKRGGTRKAMKKMTQHKTVSYSLLYDDDGKEETICDKEMRVTKENWDELVAMTERHHELKIYIPIMDRDDTFMVISDSDFYVYTDVREIEDEYGTTPFTSDEARELSGFTL